MSMTFFFSKVRERPATRQHPCANNNGYGFQNEQIANRCFFSVINRHNVCEQKKKTFWWVENLTNMIWWIFLERNRKKKKKKKETLSVGIPSCANHTVRHQKHNFTSRLDKKLKRAPQKQNNWKKKKEKYKHPVTVQDEKVYKLEDEQKTADCVQQQHWTQEILTTRQCEWVIGLLHCAAIHIHCLHHEN